MCNGLLECADASDETNCMQCCDGAIIQMVHRCDGKFDCPDGSDEMYCHNLSIHNTTFLFTIFVIFSYSYFGWIMSLHFLDCGPEEYFCLANHCVTVNEGN